MSVTRNTRGQATPLWAIVLVLSALLLVPLALLARATIERSGAQNVADATALAGALEGRQEAERIAVLNRARLESYESNGNTVEVVVIVGGRRATARALRDTALVTASTPSHRQPNTPP